jgi:hypothetical protein
MAIARAREIIGIPLCYLFAVDNPNASADTLREKKQSALRRFEVDHRLNFLDLL